MAARRQSKVPGKTGRTKNFKTESIGKTVFILIEGITEHKQSRQQAISFLAERLADVSKRDEREATGKQFN